MNSRRSYSRNDSIFRNKYHDNNDNDCDCSDCMNYGRDEYYDDYYDDYRNDDYRNDDEAWAAQFEEPPDEDAPSSSSARNGRNYGRRGYGRGPTPGTEPNRRGRYDSWDGPHEDMDRNPFNDEELTEEQFRQRLYNNRPEPQPRLYIQFLVYNVGPPSRPTARRRAD